MAEPSWPESVELSAYLTDAQTAQVKLRVPVPVVVLAAQLMHSVPRRVGVRNASELVAALLVKALDDTEALGKMVGDYRETRTHGVLETAEVEGPFELPARAEVELS